MLRKKIMHSEKEKRDRIRWRSHEVTRIEAFSDAVIAFSVTLLIVSLEVPESLKDLMHNMAGFLPFAVCFLLLFYIWKTQHIFFRRYNLHDERTYNLNGILLFVLLFFVYPLKFLSNYILKGMMGEHLVTTGAEFTKLMCIYSGGYTAIFILFALMYQNAFRKREELELTDIEVFETKTSIYMHTIMACFGIISITLALISYKLLPFSGFVYALIGVAFTVFFNIRNKKFKQLFGDAQPVVIKEDKELIV